MVVLVLCSALAPAPTAAAQPASPPVIHRVTLQPETGVLTITGTGLNGELVVTVEGQAVTVLPGATETRVEVAAPAAMLSAPGSYRLMVVDPARHVGDAFVVASPPAGRSPDFAQVGTGPAVGDGRTAMGSGSGAIIAGLPPGSSSAVPSRGVSPNLVDSGTNTAVGVDALAHYSSGGISNTAVGMAALYENTTGSENTATGVNALGYNTTGGGRRR
jgi:hypothetical protein